jgi:hypothetical protein
MTYLSPTYGLHKLEKVGARSTTNVAPNTNRHRKHRIARGFLVHRDGEEGFVDPEGLVGISAQCISSNVANRG